jgi:hypothetical protein
VKPPDPFAGWNPTAVWSNLSGGNARFRTGMSLSQGKKRKRSRRGRLKACSTFGVDGKLVRNNTGNVF